MFSNASQTNVNPLFTAGNLSEIVSQNQNDILLTGERREIAFVDSHLNDYQTLVQGLEPGIKVVVLDSNQNGINLITQFLSNQNYDIDGIHIFSHGASGTIQLGNTVLNQSNLGNYQSSLTTWGQSLKADGDLLFYGCNVAAGTTGQDFLQNISQITGADVAASDDVTGNAQLGGDWNLEYAIGDINTTTLINNNYSSILDASLSNGKVIFTGNNLKETIDLSVENGKLIVKNSYLTSTFNQTQNTITPITVNNQWDFALSSISSIELDTGAGNDNINFHNLDFGKTVSLTVLPGENLNDVTFSDNSYVYTYGGNINITGTKVNVGQGAVISTRKVEANPIIGLSTGNSGSITFNGNINVGSTDTNANVAKILTTANNGYQAGDINFKAEKKGSFSPQLGLYNNDNIGVNINLNKSEINAGNINLYANVDTSNIFETGDAAFLETIEPVVKFLDAFSLIAGVARTKTRANINLSKDSKITATSLEAQALTTSLAATSPVGLTLGVGVGIIDAKSEILVEGEITTTGNLSILARNDNTLKIFTESDPDPITKLGFAAAVAVSVLDSEATAKVANTAKLNVGGDLNVYARTISRNLTTALSATGEDGSVGLAFAFSDEDNYTNALVDGTAIVTGSTTIQADQVRKSTEVNLGLTVLNGVAAGAGVNTSSRGNLLTDTMSSVMPTLIDAVKKKLSSKTADAATKSGGQAQSLDLGSAVAIADYSNNVTARIGAGATVKSQGDISINAKVDSRPDVGAGSAISDPSDGNASAPNQPAKVAISAAVAIGDYKNNAYAYIDNNATVDAQKALTIKSEAVNDFQFTYGVNLFSSLTTEPEKTYDSNQSGTVTVKLDDIIQVADGHEAGGEVGNFYQFLGVQADIDLSKEDFSNSSRWENLGSTASYKAKNFVQTLTTYLDGNLGLDNNLGDSFTQSTAKGDKFALAGAVTVLSLDQISQAYIGENAKINQDSKLRSGEQIIAVEALNINEAVNLIGNIETPGISGNVQKLSVPSLSVGGAGTGAKGGAVGGSVLISNYTNQVTAKITKGVQLYGDSLKVNADNTGLGVAVAVSGGSAGTFGANGSVVVVDVDNITTAQVEDGAKLTIGKVLVKDEEGNDLNASLIVNANDLSLIVNIVGGIVVSNNVGIGASVSINNINRQVNALIGNLDGSPSDSTLIDAQGNIDIKANAEGELIGLSLAAAVVNEKKPQPPTPPAKPLPGVSKDDPLDGASLPNLFAESSQVSNDQGNQGKYGLAISGDVSINQVNDQVRAYINNAGTIKTPKDITIDANNNTNLIALSGSAAIVTKPDGKSAGLAGSVSLNLLTGETKAYITGNAKVNAQNLTLDAYQEGDIFALTAAASATMSQQSFAVAGSVAINQVTNTTESSVNGATVTLSQHLTSKAQDDSGIIAIGGSLAYGGKAGIGAAVGVNTINSKIKAAIANTTLKQQGNLTLEANNHSKIIAITASIGASQTIGGAGTVSVNKINTTTAALLDNVTGGTANPAIGGNTSVKAQNNSAIWSLAGAVGIGKTGGLGAAVAYNKITDNTYGRIRQSNLTMAGGLSIQADSDRAIWTLSLGVGGGKTGALGGSVSINLIDGGTEAYIDGNSNITAQGEILAKAATDDEIHSLSGGFALASKVAIGAAVAYNEIDTKTRSYISSSTVKSQTNQITLDANSNSEIESLSVSGAGAGTAAIAGSVSINQIDTEVAAYISNNANVSAAGAIQLLALDDSHIASAAGQVSIGGKAGIGASVSTNNLNNRVAAYINSSQVTSTTNSVSLKADLGAKIGNITVGGSGAGTFALGGSVTVNKINTVTQADISNNSIVQAAQQLNVLATDNSNIESLAGLLAGAGTAAVGASVSTNNVNNQVKAEIANSKVTANSVAVKAYLTANISNITAGGAGAGTFAAGGSVTVNHIQTQTRAGISNGANIQAQQNIEVIATNNATIESLAGQISAAGAAAIGAAVAVNNSHSNTTAYINDSDVTSSTGQVKVVANDTSTIKSLSAGASLTGKVALTGSVSVNNINNIIDAHALNAKISANNLEVTAKDDATIKSLAGQISVAILGGGVGAAVAYNNIGNTVKAYVTADDGKFTTINTSGNALISASGKGTIETIAAGGSAGLFVGAGASVAVNQMTNNISAFVHNSSIKAQGSVGILADATNSMTTTGGTFSGGLVGLGGTIAVNNLQNTTRAYVNNASIDGVGQQSITIPKADGTGATELLKGVAILATSKDNLDVTIGTAGVGGVSFVASVAVNSFQNTTEAYAHNVAINAITGSTIPQQSVYIKAFNESTVKVNAGTAGVGISAAAGVGIDITTMKNATTAYINSSDLINSQGSVVNANNDLVVQAKTQKSLTSNVLAFGGGLGFSVQGAVSILNVSSGMSGDALTATSDTESKVAQQLTDLNSMGKDSNGNSNINTKAVSSNFATNLPTVKGTTAFIAGTASAGNNLIINAYEITKLDASVTGASIGAIGAGAAIAIANITHNASAYVGENSRVNAFNTTIQSTGFVDSTKVTAKAGAAGGLALGAAVAYLTSSNNSKAYIGENSKVNINGQAEVVNVIANSASKLETDAKGVSLGVAAVGVVLTKTEETGVTSAYLAQGVQVQKTNNLNVTANVDESVKATGLAGGGGLISGSGVEVKANVNPYVAAYIGDNNTIKVAKNVNVGSNVIVDGDADTQGKSYGALAVGLAFSEVNSNPTINTYVGANTTIEAGNVKISSSLGEARQPADTSFNPSNAVNNAADSITFSDNHGLRTGDTVVYSNGGGNNINGLTNQGSYSVIVVDDQTVKLGSEFDAATVDTKFNTIKFAKGHGFTNNQQVIYEAKSDTSSIGGLTSGEKYYVKVIDGSTIQLSQTPVVEDVNQGARLTGITTPSGGTTTVNVTNNVFQNGDTVVYKKRSALFTVDKTLPDTGGKPNIFNLSTGDIVSKDTINSASHGFETGDQVIYTTTGSALDGLTQNQKYYVIKVDDNKFKLSLTNGGEAIDITSATAGTSHKITAVGLKTASVSSFTYSTANANKITVTNHGFTTGQAVRYSGTSAIGLTNGATYYVINVDSNNFKLASTIGGTEISLTAAAGSHLLTVIGNELEEGVTYYVINRTDTSFQLSKTKGGSGIALDTSELTGTGANHIFVKQSVIDLTSSSTGAHNLHIDLENGTATGSQHLLSSGSAIVLPSQGDQVFSAYSQASAGALAGGTGTKTNINITPSFNTYIGNNASVTATGNVTVSSISNIEVSGGTTSETGGAIAVGASKINLTVTNNNNAYVGNSASIKAEGNVTIDSHSDNDIKISASGGAGSLITFADADAVVNLTHNTITSIQDNASIIANDDLALRSSSNTKGKVKVKASGVGLYADADANGEFYIDGTNRTDIKSNTRLEGRTVTAEAIVDNLDVEARSDAQGAGLIGNIDAHSTVDLAGTDATVNIGSGAYLKGDYINLNAIYKTVNSNAIAYADCDGLGGDTDSDTRNKMPLSAQVITDATSILDVYKLNLKSALENVSYRTDSHSDKAWELRIWTPFGTIVITMDFGSESENETFSPTSTINFNSNVNFMARGENPVLVINEQGQIAQKSNNVNVSFSNNDAIVSDIKTTDFGEANFTGTLTDNGKYRIKDPGYDAVQIDNYSSKNLIINSIDAINLAAASQLKYTVNGSSYNRSVNADLPVNPTVVTINNWGSSNLILQGVINNPHDRTILYSGGNIFRQGTTQKIITRDLKMTAKGSIGANNQDIAAQLTQGYKPVTANVADSNIYLNVEAQNSTYLNLTAKTLDNNPVTVNVQRMTAYTGEVNLTIGQTTNQANASVAAMYKFTDNLDIYQRIMAANNIVINAGNTTTNINAKTIYLGGTGSLNVVTGGLINVNNLAAAVNVQQAISYQDAVNLSGTDLTLVDNGVIQAAKDVTLTSRNLSMLNNAKLTAGINVNLLEENRLQIDANSVISAGNNVVIQGDYKNQNTAGASINLDGWIYGKQMSIFTQGNNDVVNIRRLATTTNVYTGGGNDIVNVGSSQNRTNEIQKRLTIYGETQTNSDTLNINNSGDTANTVGILTDTSLTGLGMGEGIYYNGFEVFNLRLGTGNDDLTILNTGATTNIDSGAGDDKFRIGPKVDANGQVLNETVNGVLLSGFNILGTRHITNINAGAGNDYIQVNRNTAILNIQGGIGDDTFEVNTPINFSSLLTNAQVNISGDNGNDRTIINSSSLLPAIKNNGSSVEVVNSRLISLMTNESLVINNNVSSTGTSGASTNTSSSSLTLSSLSNRTSVTTNTTNTSGSSLTLSSLSDRSLTTSTSTSSFINPLLLGLFSR